MTITKNKSSLLLQARTSIVGNSKLKCENVDFILFCISGVRPFERVNKEAAPVCNWWLFPTFHNIYSTLCLYNTVIPPADRANGYFPRTFC